VVVVVDVDAGVVGELELAGSVVGVLVGDVAVELPVVPEAAGVEVGEVRELAESGPAGGGSSGDEVVGAP
jgi:hypothetical protein